MDIFNNGTRKPVFELCKKVLQRLIIMVAGLVSIHVRKGEKNNGPDQTS